MDMDKATDMNSDRAQIIAFVEIFAIISSSIKMA
jgi:hypothetical protein